MDGKNGAELLQRPITPSKETAGVVPDNPEINPLSEQELKAARADLIDIDLRLKAAKDKAIVKDFKFTEKEGFITVEYTTFDGFTMKVELGQCEMSHLPLGYDINTRNYLAVKNFEVTLKETGRKFDLMRAPFRQAKEYTVFNIRQAPYSNLSEVGPGDLEKFTDKGLQFLADSTDDGKGAFPSCYDVEKDVVVTPLPLTSIQLALRLHEDTHAEDPNVKKRYEIYKRAELRDTGDKAEELQMLLELRLAAKLTLLNEQKAAKGMLGNMSILTEGVKDHQKILDAVKLQQAAWLLTYVEFSFFFMNQADRDELAETYTDNSIFGIPMEKLRAINARTKEAFRHNRGLLHLDVSDSYRDQHVEKSNSDQSKATSLIERLMSCAPIAKMRNKARS